VNDILQVQGINSKGFGIIPKLVMQDKRLTTEAKAIYSYFCSYAGAGKTAFPSRSKIISDLGMGINRYYKHFELLKKYGYIKAEQEQFEQIANQSYYGKGLIIMLYTGLRVGELMALTWEHIDFEKCVLRVEQTATEYMDYEGDVPKISRSIGTPKTKASIRAIPLTPIVVELLEQLKVDYPISDEYIFGRLEGGHVRYLRFWECTNTIAKQMGIEGLHPHCMRHTFATRCLEKGINIKVIQELLGHSSIKMTVDMYTQTTDDMKKDSIMKLVSE